MSTQATPCASKGVVVATIKKKLAEHQLPVLRKTVARIVSLSSTMKSDIGELAQTILQDQSFTAKVLSVANSAYYKHRPEPIITITRAIIQIGYSTLRDIAIAAEFTEMAQKRLPVGVNLHRLLAKAFVASHHAKNLSHAIHLEHAEEIFTRTLLQSIGEFALAYYMPEEYREIDMLIHVQGLTSEAAHHKVLGITSQELTAEILNVCELPPQLISVAPNWASAESWGDQEKMHAIAVIATEVTNNLFAGQTPQSHPQLTELLRRAGKAFGLPLEELEQLITEAFRKACGLGHSLDLDVGSFFPAVPETISPDYVVHPLIESCVKIIEPLVASSLDKPPALLPSESIGSAGLLVSFLTDLTHYMITASDLNTVLTSVLEGLHRAVGFDHVFVLLTVPGKSLATGRYGVGPNAPAMVPIFSISTAPHDNMLAHCMAIRTPMRLSFKDKPPYPMPASVIQAIHPIGIALAPLHTANHTFGLIWADRVTGEIDEATWKAFQLFTMQANVALVRLTTKS